MIPELLKIIEGGLNKDTSLVKSYATLMAEKFEKSGEEKVAERIKKVLEKSSIHPVYLDEFVSKPVDRDSRLEMVDVEITPPIPEKIVLPKHISNQVENFISSLKHRDEFIKMGIDLPESLLLYGPPGCGKTSVARYISNRTQLPLVVAKLDALVSSLLGNTAKNISKIFNYAKNRPCILFLDEFDAIAKARDDKHEVGELKRVVNSLLQNIDEFNKENILIAATNHENMLDPAIWRRFSNVINISLPDEEEIIQLLFMFLKEIDVEFKDDARQLKIIIKNLIGLSPADIKTLCYNTIKNIIINNQKSLSYGAFLYNIYLHKNISFSDKEIINFLYENDVKQKEIVEILNVSIRQVRKEIKGGGEI
ncbi:ATP-binding protein [Clostridium sp. DJ247]|nr:ATP-binding protein [Clostridium sp. DJ247]